MDSVIGLNSSSSVEMWLDNVQIYSSDLWYGVKFPGSNPDGVRTGNTYMHKNLPVQSNFKGCTITDDGKVKYLKPGDWGYYTDDTAIDSSLNVMVEIPAHSIMTVFNGDTMEIRMSPYYLPGFTQIKKQYVSAYEAYVDNGKLRSKREVLPTVSTTREDFQSYARANGSAHWNMYTYEAHKAITWCFVVEYATLNSQKAVNSTLTSEGYHQGGLGSGCTTGAVDEVYSFMHTGTSDSLGNGTGEVDWTDNTNTRKCNRYRGIENPFGHIRKNCIDIIFTGVANRVYKCDDYLKFGNDRSVYTDTGINDSTDNGYLQSIVHFSSAELFAANVGGSESTYFCDYHYTSANNTDRILLLGADANDDSNSGLFYLASDSQLGCVNHNVGSRLTYIP